MNRFADLHPGVLFFYFVCVLGVSMFLPHPLLLAAALLGGLLTRGTLESPGKALVSLLYYTPTLLIIALTNPLFSHRGKTILTYFLGNPITLESLLYGANLGLMLITVMCWFHCFGLIFTSDKLLYLTAGRLPKTALILSITFRFVPLFRKQIRKIYDSGKAMGLYSETGIRAKLRGAKRVFLIMLSRSLEQGIDTGGAMNARGWALPDKTRYTVFRFYFRDCLVLAAVLLLILPVLIPAARGALEFGFYPALTSTNPSSAAVAAAAFGALCLLPFLIQCKESLKWNYYVSKI